jgi:hypothetical protein
MKTVSGQYIPRTGVGDTAPDAGTSEVIVTASRLPNWVLIAAILGSIALAFMLDDKEG